MASFSKREREDYNKHREHVGKELGLNKNHYNALRRVSQGLHKAGENYANGTTGGEPKYRGNEILNRYEDKHYNKDVASHFKKAEALRKKMGGKSKIHFHHQTDPRGAALYAAKEKLNSTNYSSKGHVIY